MVRAGITAYEHEPSIGGGSSLKKLFLSHYNGDAREVAVLAEQLRVRGIVPWVDKQGGFQVGDKNADEARRAIQEDCLGCLLYATPEVFERPFITDIEMPAALERHSQDDGYLIFAVPRRISFSELALKSKKAFGFNLADHHCIPVSDNSIAQGLATVAEETLEKLVCGHRALGADKIRIQYGTREIFPSGEEELLCIDGRSVYRNDGIISWEDLFAGLRNVKRVIVKAFGRPAIIVEGSKHLTSAFLFGRVFQPFELQIRQTPAEYWTSSGVTAELELDVGAELKPCEDLVVTVASGDKKLLASAVETVGHTSTSQLSIAPAGDRFNLASDSSRWLASAVYRHIDRAVATVKPKRLHLFMAIPQATAMKLGQKFAGMPDTIVYDWNGNSYEAGKMIPRGVL